MSMAIRVRIFHPFENMPKNKGWDKLTTQLLPEYRRPLVKWLDEGFFAKNGILKKVKYQDVSCRFPLLIRKQIEPSVRQEPPFGSNQ